MIYDLFAVCHEPFSIHYDTGIDTSCAGDQITTPLSKASSASD
jgi:hypothetical protein